MLETARGRVPVRSSSEDVHQLLARGLRTVPVAEGFESRPQGYGVRVADDESAFHWLYWGRCPVVRTRDAGRLLGALEQHLSAPGRAEGDQLVLRMSAGVTAEGQAFILPPLGAEVARLDRRLRDAGAALVDGPFAVVDPVRGELVVTAPDITIGPDVRDALVERIGSARAEAVVRPGRYPLGHWLVETDAPQASRGSGLAHLLGHLAAPATQRGVEAATSLVTQLRTVVLAMRDVSRVPAALGLEPVTG